jgi:hypothetical protein
MMKTVCFSMFMLLFPMHDFHLSLTEIDHNVERKTLEVSIKLFTDDLSLALQAQGAPKMEIGTDREPPQANELIENYLRRNVKFVVNTKPVVYKYLGKQAEMDATWCFLEIPNVSKVQTIEIINTLLIDQFDDETNMVNLNIAGRKKSGMSRKGNTTLKFEFN